MTNQIATTVKRALGRSEWTPPRFDMPIVIDAAELTQIGELRGQSWFSHDRFGELQADRAQLLEHDILPDRPLTSEVVDGARRYQAYAAHRPGTFERLASEVPAAPPTAAKPRPIDALAGHPLLDRQTAVVVAAPSSRASGVGGFASDTAEPVILPTRRSRGAEAIIASLASKGIEVRLSTDGQAIVSTSSGGRSTTGANKLIAMTRPLLVAYLGGIPPVCNTTIHEVPAEAVTVGPGGNLLCQDCKDGDA